MGNTKTPGAISLRCDACGGAFRPAEIALQVRCPFCREAQIVAPDLLERLNTYHDEVQGQVDAIAEERRGAARYDRWYGRMRRGSPATVAGVTVGFMLVPFLLGGFLWGLVSLLGEQTVGRWMPYLPAPLFGMVFLVLAAWTAWMYSGPRRRRTIVGLESAALACPGCGAVSQIEPGVPATACEFCGASLLPSEPVMGRSLESAQRARLAARLERYRVEREGITKVYSYTMQGYAHWMVLAPFSLMTGGGAVAFSVEMAMGHEKFHPGIFLLWAMFFAVVGTGVGISLYRRNTRDRWRAAMAAVARGSSGELVVGLDGLAGWLDHHWAGPYDPRFLFTSTSAHGASVTVGGYQGLLWVEPTPASDQHPARVHIFLAAWIPGVADHPIPDAARGLLAELQREHDVQQQPGGLFIALEPMEVKQLRRDPATATELAPVFPKLAAIADALGARPVTPGGTSSPQGSRTSGSA